MIRFLTWLITVPAVKLIELMAKIKYRRTYKSIERTCDNIARGINSQDAYNMLDSINTTKLYKEFQKRLTLRDRFELWRMRKAVKVAGFINKQSWKRVEKNLYKDE